MKETGPRPVFKLFLILLKYLQEGHYVSIITSIIITFSIPKLETLNDK